jgi:2-polyprenyl-6-methoxyphenol hydroxylase-like FAD-dependent oxidoreductase
VSTPGGAVPESTWSLLREPKASSAGRWSAIRPHPFAVNRGPFVAPHVLLVGDAAGVEPLMGEGISFALEYGRWAAGEILAARDRGDYAFDGAEERFRRSWVGRKLRRLGQAATMFYGPGARVWLGLAARWQGAQEVGLRWYNGVDGFDRRSGWDAFRTALRWSFSPPPGS